MCLRLCSDIVCVTFIFQLTFYSIDAHCCNIPSGILLPHLRKLKINFGRTNGTTVSLLDCHYWCIIASREFCLWWRWCSVISCSFNTGTSVFMYAQLLWRHKQTTPSLLCTITECKFGKSSNGMISESGFMSTVMSSSVKEIRACLRCEKRAHYMELALLPPCHCIWLEGLDSFPAWAVSSWNHPWLLWFMCEVWFIRICR